MKKAYRLIIILVLFLSVLPLTSFAEQFNGTRVYDGDTIKAKRHDIEIKVRLVGIYTHETSKIKRQPG